jgi:putative Holliday junction resolvase
MPSGRLLGIDHGLRRIGLAVCDASQMVARELTIIRRKSRQEDYERINHIAAEQRAVAIIVGLPSDLDAPPDAHTQADTVRLWADRLRETTERPVLLWDEQLTSHDAEILAREKRRKPTDPIDDLAARLILQSYLDALRDGLAPPPLRDAR